ncbi:MAG: PKD domain-containing protein [Trichormus sp. ATA11-4-KO1]|nr:PKD domain-containing protein [Trichormus sp. ATA11-4-KO1]
MNQLNPSKIALSISIPSQQLLSSYFPSHELTSNFFSNLKYSVNNIWGDLLTSETPTLNISFQITNLPTGQLAEAQLTQFDPQGRPNGGTILIDHDANGYSWFIDPTPLDNSEFTTSLTDTTYRATTGDAFGKYDLLTTILHETGHLLGIISGNPGFDRYIQTINSTKTFIGDNFTATLTPDGSHLDSQVHPYDLMNNTLSPGLRKLPSWLNLQMINAIRNTTVAPSSTTQLTAPLTAILLADITNGNFNFSDTTKPEYGWTTRGAATILNPTTLSIQTNPTNSTIQLTPDGTVTYTPNPTFVGIDTYTYTITDTEGLTSNTATVNNIAPVITVITGDTTTTEGTTANFSATAVDPGDELTYLWNFGDGSQLVEGENVTHTYTDNGTYIATLTVIDSLGVNSFQTLEITVNHVAPREITKLKFEQKLLHLRVYENSQLVEHVKGRQNQPVSPLAFDRIQILALNNNGQSQIFDDITFHDSGEGIGTIEIPVTPLG